MKTKAVVLVLSCLGALAYILYTGEYDLLPFFLLIAHCDTMDGPVIKEARKALQDRNVEPVLKWVPEEEEAVIREAFAKTLEVRALGARAMELADMYFFETLVRIHRAAEGAPYTGIKPAGAAAGPGVAAADEAVEKENVSRLLEETAAHVAKGIRERFQTLIEKKKRAGENVEDGRRYVASYVDFIHYVEKLYQGSPDHGSHDGHAAPEKSHHH